MEMPYGTALSVLAERSPDSVAVVCDGQTHRRGDLERDANRLARAYAGFGVRPGDLVTLALPNGVEAIIAAHAVWKLGAVPQLISWRLPDPERAAIVELAQPRLVVGVEGPTAGAPHVPQGYVPPSDLSAERLEDRLSPNRQVITSGGSTGRPKLIVDPVPASIDPDAESYTVPPGTRTLIPGPMYHAGPFLNCHWTLLGPCPVELLPRASLLQRRDPSTDESQPIAANVDVVGIVCGLDRPIAPGRIQRFTSLAWDAGAAPLVILSKADLVESTEEIENDLLRQDPAAEIISVSSATTDGVSVLLERCANQTLVLVGESGAGKSALLNALAGRELSATGGVRAGDSKGRHTTTARQLFVLEGNCRLIDTPGVREVGIHTDVDTIDDGFSDIRDLAALCHFNDCGHSNEPGCEVLNALADGRLDKSRMTAWEQLRREAAWAEIRTDPAAQHRADRKLGRVIRDTKRAKRR